MKYIIAQLSLLIIFSSVGFSEDQDKQLDYQKNSRRAVPRDAFPVLDNPKMESAATREIEGSEPVIGVNINGQAKAYPISVMGRHELVNDLCGKAPITISW